MPVGCQPPFDASLNREKSPQESTGRVYGRKQGMSNDAAIADN
jgi:hypothetical protein